MNMICLQCNNQLLYLIVMLKSQYQSTNGTDQPQSDSTILLRIDSLSSQYLHYFLNDQKSDFKIYHRHYVYPAHSFIVLKNMNNYTLDSDVKDKCIELSDLFNDQLVTGILSCLYGMEVQINRNQIVQALDIIHYLKISKLKKLIQQDILQNFEEYEIFPLLESAIQIGFKNIEELCYNHLQDQDFEQLRYCKYQLLSCKEEVFKIVIYKHNQRKWEDPTVGINDKVIQDLINQYAKHNNYSEKQKSVLIKTITERSIKDLNLDSFELEQNINPFKKQTKNISIKVYTPKSANRNSFISPFCFKDQDNKGSQSMIMDLTFMDKNRSRKSSHGSDNSSSQMKLSVDVIHLKEANIHLKDQISELQASVTTMSLNINKSRQEYEQNTKMINEMLMIHSECQKMNMQNHRNLRILQVKFKKMSSRRLSLQIQSFSLLQDDQQDYNNKIDQVLSQLDLSDPNEIVKDERYGVDLIQSKWVLY